MRTNDRGVPAAMLSAAARALDDVDLDTLSDAQLGGDLRSLWTALCRLHAQFSRRVAVFDSRGAAGRDGARSTRDWLRRRLRLDGVDAARQVSVAEGLATLEHAGPAYLRGEISADHLAAIRDAAWL